MKTHLMKLALLLLITAFVACGSDDAASDSDTSADVQDDSSAEVTPDTVDPDAVDPDTVDPDTVDPDTVDPCEDGDLQCADDAILQVCADGVWTQEADCTAQGQICLEHTCVDETPEVGYVGQDKCKSCHSGMNADIVAAYAWMASAEGVFAEPASAAGVAGLKKACAQGRVASGSTVVCTLTGHGLKDPETAIAQAPAWLELPASLGAVVEAAGLT